MSPPGNTEQHPSDAGLEAVRKELCAMGERGPESPGCMVAMFLTTLLFAAEMWLPHDKKGAYAVWMGPVLVLFLIIEILTGKRKRRQTQQALQQAFAKSRCPVCGAATGEAVLAAGKDRERAMHMIDSRVPREYISFICPACGESLTFVVKSRTVVISPEVRAAEFIRERPLTVLQLRNRRSLDAQDRCWLALRDFAAAHRRGTDRIRMREEFIQHSFCGVRNVSFLKILERGEGDSFLGIEGCPEALDPDMDALRAATESAMQIAPAARRPCLVQSDDEWVLTGAVEGALILPSGDTLLYLEVVPCPPAVLPALKRRFDFNWVRLWHLRITDAAGRSVSLTVNRRPAQEALTSGTAVPWDRQPPEWRAAFQRGTLYSAGDALNPQQNVRDFEWQPRSIQVEIGGIGYSGEVKDSPAHASGTFTLAVPDGSGALWGRIHGLELVDFDASDGITIVPPFCFPINARDFLTNWVVQED